MLVAGKLCRCVDGRRECCGDVNDRRRLDGSVWGGEMGSGGLSKEVECVDNGCSADGNGRLGFSTGGFGEDKSAEDPGGVVDEVM